VQAVVDGGILNKTAVTDLLVVEVWVDILQVLEHLKRD
jgi:hypothetical protein